jgi:hypothetical protein
MTARSRPFGHVSNVCDLTTVERMKTLRCRSSSSGRHDVASIGGVTVIPGPGY